MHERLEELKRKIFSVSFERERIAVQKSNIIKEQEHRKGCISEADKHQLDLCNAALHNIDRELAELKQKLKENQR